MCRHVLRISVWRHVCSVCGQVQIQDFDMLAQLFAFRHLHEVIQIFSRQRQTGMFKKQRCGEVFEGTVDLTSGLEGFILEVGDDQLPDFIWWLDQSCHLLLF